MYYHNPDVQNEIRKRAKEGRVIFSDHGNEQSEDRDIEDLDILSCLKSGILEGEDWNAKYQETTYRMVKNHSLSSRLTVVVALIDSHDIVVTAFMKERK
jgi:hypothetical protein